MDFVTVLFRGFRKTCSGWGAAGNERDEAVYGSDVYGPCAARGFGICAVRMDKFRDGDLVCMANRVDDCDGVVVIVSAADLRFTDSHIPKPIHIIIDPLFSFADYICFF